MIIFRGEIKAVVSSSELVNPVLCYNVLAAAAAGFELIVLPVTGVRTSALFSTTGESTIASSVGFVSSVPDNEVFRAPAGLALFILLLV